MDPLPDLPGRGREMDIERERERGREIGREKPQLNLSDLGASRTSQVTIPILGPLTKLDSDLFTEVGPRLSRAMVKLNQRHNPVC